ncbi:uncharacterized protein [Diadema antillarum]|uniref:uncharacterized protein n=1 Tax=Diadema antillarum TaxID=105358 RepID=UPI003A8590E3
MNWRAQSKPVPARFGYNIRISRFNLFLSRSASYRPDLLDGSIGLKGVQLFDLDANPSDYINPRAYCLNWYNKARGPLIHQFFHQPCPCSVFQAIFDFRFTSCNYAYSFQTGVSTSQLTNFNPPFYLFLRSFSFFGFIPFNGCFQPRWPLLGQGYRCTYSWWLRRGYSGFWRSSHFQSVLPFNGRFRLYSDFLRWIENDVLPQYFCCSRSGNQRFCRMYESLRPPSTCRFYRNPFIAWFFGDPHINTLDNRGYTFNGLGEYVMLEYTNGNPFVLQARMGKAFDEKGQELDTGTVFTGFAAGQGGTTLRITLNAERTEMLIQVNESFVDLETLRADGFNSTDDDFSLSFVSDDDGSNSTEDTTTNNNSTSVEASFIYAGQTPTGFTVTFNQGVLDVTMSVAPDYAGEGVTRGLLGVWNDDPSDDFQERDGDTLMPEAGQNLTEREIFEFGQTWMVSANDSLFDYGNDSWATYNDPNYTPLFLDELLANATDEQRTAAENTCQGDRSCLFDYLAVGPQLGASSMATNALRESEKQGLENFPPEITDIVEVGDTDALMENNTLYVIVGETYTLQVTATDPNNDTVTFSLNGTVPGSAEITDNGTFTWTPMNTTLVAIDIVASDGIVASSETLSVKVCRCENNGTCDFDTDAEGEDFTENKFAVVVCNCTEGWTGTHCEEDEDSCDGDPCFEGVICYDLPPPSTEPDCGPCPPSLTGDGLNCFDIDECFNSSLNACEQNCENTDGSYICSCKGGYMLQLDQRNCSDINECDRGLDDCPENSICTNTEGSFNCSCDMGFQDTNQDVFACQDINECLNPDQCDTNADCNNTIGSFTCTCFDGYVGSGSPNDCADEDECRNDVHNCHKQATCINEIGYFRCSCNSGWTGNGTFCEDINECEVGTDACHHNATCINTVGSYQCECNTGFVGNGFTCVDVDECADKSLNTCPAGSECVNTAGSFQCPCLNGYNETANGTCEDINECDLGYCDVNANCTNSIGSFSCECREFYQGDGTNCEDIDECNLGLDDCSQRCTNEEPGYNCSCLDGFLLVDSSQCELDPNATCSDDSNPCGNNTICAFIDGVSTCFCDQAGFGYETPENTSCIDINECVENNVCGVRELCNNTEGSFVCGCPDGFVLAANERDCEDLDECENAAQVCAENAVCTNTEGSYTCRCEDGYSGSGYLNETCDDIDECNSTMPVCGIDAICNNTIGSYLCTCPDGYLGNAQTLCVDIDECFEGECDVNADCANSPGSFNCSCRAGYMGTGLNCTDVNECVSTPEVCATNATCSNTIGSFTCMCEDGLRGNAYGNNSCNDIDECTEQPDICHANAVCDNVDGSYTCTCENGYQGDGTSCEDINECEDDNFCGSNSMCDDTIGSAFCTCEDGFQSQTDNGKNCQDFDECMIGVDLCPEVSTCVNTPGDYNCTCDDGYENMGPKTCMDIDECQNNLHNCQAADNRVCFNVPGNFTCVCAEMFAERDGTCVAAETYPLVVMFTTIMGFTVASDPTRIQSIDNQNRLANNVLAHLKLQPETEDTLAVSVYNFTLLGVSSWK